LKQKIYSHCLHLLDQKIESLNSALKAATEAANNETKSSAGDKHETSRAMMQIEQEKLGKQLKELLEQKTELEKIDPDRYPNKTSTKILKGNLIQTDKGFLFLGIGLGKMLIDDETVFAISPQSPLGLKLLGLKENDAVEMNGMKYTILKLF
jgi:hypothetical protein